MDDISITQACMTAIDLRHYGKFLYESGKIDITFYTMASRAASQLEAFAAKAKSDMEARR